MQIELDRQIEDSVDWIRIERFKFAMQYRHEWQHVIDAAVCCCIFVESKWTATSCDFEDSYMCGYTSEALGSLRWIWKQANDISIVSGGPNTDWAESPLGQLQLFIHPSRDPRLILSFNQPVA